MSVRNINLVVKSTDGKAAVERYSALLESSVSAEFPFGNSGLTVSVLRGVSILSGTEDALARTESPVATAFVDSLSRTRAQLGEAGWTLEGEPGSPSVLARDADGYLIEFVELPAL